MISNDMIEQARAMVVALWAVVMTALAPTLNALLLLVVFAMVNGFVGWQSNSIVSGERFKLSKFWHAFVQLGFYMMLVVLLHLAFHIFGEVEKSGIAIRIVSWIAVWGYTTKILQNFLMVFPKTRGVRLLYNLLAVKFIPKLLSQWGIEVNDKDVEGILHDGEKKAAERTEE